MGIEKNYTQTAEVYRLGNEESGYGQDYSLHLADVACHLQPLDDRYSEDIEGSFGKDFLMICGNVDIKEGDRVTVSDIEYRVTAVEVYTLGAIQHTELTIRTFNT